MLSAPLDIDGRMRTAYNIGGSESGKSAPITFRLSSSENAFGSGMNMQNIPSDKSKTMGKAKGRGASIGEMLKLPNLRSMFIPDPGQEMWDLDLDRADLQVVCWECDDQLLKAAIRQGVDIHLLNVYTLDGHEPPPLDELVESHPKYPDHRGPRKLKREFSKVFCHATNYSGGARTVASNTGRTVHEIDRAQRVWFGAHPGIKLWHTRVENQITRFRFIENRFGYRWYIFDRVDGVLPEAIAWIPQSTVSIVINRIWMNIYQNLPEVQVLIQVHDSLVGQFPIAQRQKCLADIKAQSSIVVPYPDPLIIPTGIKTSQKSWGDCA
jgi:DNA polymerase I-like protein with 3'-5' exonuclease and polymerase domains